MIIFVSSQVIYISLTNYGKKHAIYIRFIIIYLHNVQFLILEQAKTAFLVECYLINKRTMIDEIR